LAAHRALAWQAEGPSGSGDVAKHRLNILARMPKPAPEHEDLTAKSRRPLDVAALARVTQRVQSAASAPWLHTEVARRMAERLPIIQLKPRRIVDWGSFLGASQAALAQAYPHAQILAVENDAPRRDATTLAQTQPWWSPRRWSGAAATALLPSEVVPGQAQLLWSNMALHGAVDPQAVMQQWQRALAIDGFLMFSTLGPGSLQSLAGLFAAQGWGPAFAPFVDMHDLGDMLVHAGFADPVMDQEQVTLTWANGDALLAELRQWGGNVALGRHAGLRTPRWRSQFLQQLQNRADQQGRVAITLEVVYGHAFKPAPRPRLAAETALPLEDMRAMVRAGRRAA
jgi:malonyl-CoA O-methyltransferase